MFRRNLYRMIPGSSSVRSGECARIRVQNAQGSTDLVVSNVRDAQEIIEALTQLCLSRGESPYEKAPRGMLPLLALWVGMRRRK